jgi:two-component system phosphate regulon sensor histidine kinase PhoR
MALTLEEAIQRFLKTDHTEMKPMVNNFVDGAVDVTDSQLGYFAVLNDTEDVLIMLGWSNTAMDNCSIIDKPLVYPLEQTGVWGDCIRERGPVMINDYQNCERPTKKGYPAEHVHVVRHMNLPIWEGEHMAGILGVGNKPTDYTDDDAHAMQQYAQAVWDVVKKGVSNAMQE